MVSSSSTLYSTESVRERHKARPPHHHVRTTTNNPTRALSLAQASDCFSEVFGKEIGGSHARSAIGTSALPLGIPVEIEAIVEVAVWA